MSWSKILLTNDQVVAGELSKLQKAFEVLFMAHGAPREMALFQGERDNEDNLPVYFSPGSKQYASELINSYHGKPSPKPEKTPRLIHLVGHANASDLLK